MKKLSKWMLAVALVAVGVVAGDVVQTTAYDPGPGPHGVVIEVAAYDSGSDPKGVIENSGV